MKKRVLLSYVLALQILLANMSFAGYAVPVQEFFPEQAVVEQQLSEQVEILPIQEIVQDKKATQAAIEIIHEDEIELFEDKMTVAPDSVIQDQELNSFVNALEQALEI